VREKQGDTCCQRDAISIFGNKIFVYKKYLFQEVLIHFPLEEIPFVSLEEGHLRNITKYQNSTWFNDFFPLRDFFRTLCGFLKRRFWGSGYRS
jgi:hypothetical protein